MSLRSLAKGFLTDDQRRSVRRAINSVTWLYEKPLALYRARDFDRRLPYIPNGRRWRSDIPFDLHFSIQQGVIEYTYRDVPTLKHPMEMALYTLLIWKLKPRTIVEIGSKAGGSAQWMADLMKIYGIDGKIISIDIAPPKPPYVRPEIAFLHGDANKLADCLSRDFLASIAHPLLVIEDSSHHSDATLAVLRFFDPVMQPGEYFIVEDGAVSDMGDDSHRGGGPGHAISQFLLETKGRYQIDASYCDRYGHNVTGNPNGYLRRV